MIKPEDIKIKKRKIFFLFNNHNAKVIRKKTIYVRNDKFLKDFNNLLQQLKDDSVFSWEEPLATRKKFYHELFHLLQLEYFGYGGCFKKYVRDMFKPYKNRELEYFAKEFEFIIFSSPTMLLDVLSKFNTWYSWQNHHITGVKNK